MFIVAVKLKAGVDRHRLDSFIKKWVPELERSTRIGSLRSMKMYSSSHTGTRLDEFVLTIDGFVQGPPTGELEELCDILYSFDCEETGSWPKAKH